MERGTPPQLRTETIGLAPTQLLYTLQGHAPESQFEENSTVGFMLHEGGFVVDEGMGGYTHTKTVTLFELDSYAETITGLVASSLRDALETRGAMTRAVEAVVPRAEWLPREAEAPGDGHDNVNIPYRTLRMPATLEGADGAGFQGPEGVSIVIVPVVTYYYAHNSGWYYGQTWGCPAGCRARVALAMYDAQGTLRATVEFDTRHIEEAEFQPNGVEIAAIRAHCHTQIEDAIERLTKQLW